MYFILFFLFCNFVYSESFESRALQFALDFLTNPGDFFFNLQNTAEDTFPVPKDKNVSFQTSLFPLTLPLTFLNLSIKSKIINEKEYIPQIDLSGNCSTIYGLNLIPESKFDSLGWHISTIITKSLEEDIRFFGGLKYSGMAVSGGFPESLTLNLGEGTTYYISSVTVGLRDIFVFTGLEFKPQVKKLILAQIGYGFVQNKIIAKIALSYKTTEIGINIYPESLLVILPVFNLHLRF